MTTSIRLAILAAVAASLAGAQSLDYATYKAKVEPIFLKKREGHARCVVCHANAGNAFRLQPLAPGSTNWTEEESRKNFEAVQRVTPAGNLKARLLLHPLTEEAGGDFFHNGGKHFTSQNDPEWQTLKAFVLGSK